MQHPMASQVKEFRASAALTAIEPSVLIIGSDRQAIKRICDCSQRLGCRVREAEDVLTALGYLDAEPSIGIAVVDGGSPWFDGLALIERMRQSHRGVRCILFASNPGTEDMVRAIRLQVADVVTDVHDDVQVEHALTRSLAALGDRRPDPLRHMPIHLNGSAEALEQAYRHGLALIETMRALRGEAVPARIVPFAPSPRPAHAPAGAAAEEGSPSDSLAALQAIQRKRAARDKFFPKGLFEDPCWDMLLDLMINHLEGRRISVSSLCIASGVAQTTALRRIADLHAQGLVRRIADEKDGRRVFIELTEAGKAAMKQYVESAGSLE